MATKPTYKPELATTDVTLPEAGTDNKIRPSEVTREVGYDFRQYLPVQEYNYQWFTVNQWINYFEEVTDDIGVTEVATQQEALEGLDNSKIMTPLRTWQFASQYGLGNTSAQSVDIDSPSLNSLTTSGEFSVVDATGGPTSLGGTVTGILKVSTRPFTDGGGDQTICHQQLVVGDVLFERFQDQTEAWSSWKTINHNIGDGLVQQGTGNAELALGTPGTVTRESTNEVSEDSHTHELDAASLFLGDLSTKGYVVLPNGLLLQWGRYGGSLSALTTRSLSFDVVFSQIFITSATAIDSGDQAKIQVTDFSNTGMSIRPGNDNLSDVHWFAIGLA